MSRSLTNRKTEGDCMVSDEDFANYWNKENLIYVAPFLLEKVDIPDRAKIFLSKVGIPYEINIDVPLKFDLLTHELLSLDQFLIKNGQRKEYSLNSDQSNFIVIGIGNDDYPICLNGANGCIISMPLYDGVTYIQFINSSIEQFAVSLIAFQKCRDRVGVENLFDDEDKYTELTQNLENELKEIDSEALNNKENWWSETIEQMYYFMI